MAYQTRGRDPLLDTNMAEAIEKRGKELLGLGLIALGLMAAMMIGSYTPDDPNWMVSTDAPVQNWLGRMGASIAAPLFMIVGWGAWSVAAVLLAWGARFALHRGEERAVGRLIFAPIGVALCSIKLMSLLMGVSILVFGAFVFGFTRLELQRLFRFMLVGLIMGYAGLMTLLGRGASGAVSAAQGLQSRQLERRERNRIEAEENAEFAANQGYYNDASAYDNAPAPAPRTGLLSKMPALVKRSDPLPEPELVETWADPELDEGPSDDRIKSKIADVIKSRVRKGGGVHTPSTAPLTRGRGRGPDPLLLDTTARGAHRAEPPLTGAQAPSPTRVEPPLVASRSPLIAERPVLELTPSEPDYDADMAVLDDDPMFDSQLPLQEAEPETTMQIPVAQPRKVVQPQVRKPVQPSKQAQVEAQPALTFEDTHPGFELPPLNLLESPDTVERLHLSDDALEENARMLENVLDDYGVKGEIVAVRPGPVVTMYELEPAPGLKASRVIGLADDIARSMAALSARVSTVPGRSVIGIELPNENREKVVLREILAARDFGDSTMRLPLALGKDIGGDPVVANLAKMPHLLIAGTTGSGKSVAINTMILSLLYKLTPQECRMIMIDPKMLELSVYDGIPHLLSPVVTDPKKAVVALKWTVGEMEERYRKMSKMGVRNIEGYNGRVRDALAKGEMFSRTVQTGFDDDTGEPIFETDEFKPEALPYIVVVVDEMADLMMVAGKEIEACIQRLAQMARASGIHLIMATQRPSVDVITGTIKANFPTRISFQVTSKIDSRTILGEMGAEQLLGMGDMLYMAGGSKIVRCHGPFVSDEEVEEIVNHLKAYGEPDYVSGVVEGPSDDQEGSIDAVLGLGGNTDGEDAQYDTAVAIVAKDRKCSTSYIQRKLGIGYNKAARLVEQMEDAGLVSPANHVGKREILIPEQG